MSDNANAVLVRRLVDAFLQGDLATVATFFATTPSWDLPGRGALAGTYKGPEEIIGFLARSFELSGGTLSLEVLDILGSDVGAAQVQRVTAHRDGRHLDCVEVLAHEIADGKIRRTWHRPDQYAIDSFFGPRPEACPEARCDTPAWMPSSPGPTLASVARCSSRTSAATPPTSLAPSSSTPRCLRVTCSTRLWRGSGGMCRCSGSRAMRCSRPPRSCQAPTWWPSLTARTARSAGGSSAWRLRRRARAAPARADARAGPESGGPPRRVRGAADGGAQGDHRRRRHRGPPAAQELAGRGRRGDRLRAADGGDRRGAGDRRGGARGHPARGVLRAPRHDRGLGRPPRAAVARRQPRERRLERPAARRGEGAHDRRRRDRLGAPRAHARRRGARPATSPRSWRSCSGTPTSASPCAARSTARRWSRS